MPLMCIRDGGGQRRLKNGYGITSPPPTGRPLKGTGGSHSTHPFSHSLAASPRDGMPAPAEQALVSV